MLKYAQLSAEKQGVLHVCGLLFSVAFQPKTAERIHRNRKFVVSCFRSLESRGPAHRCGRPKSLRQKSANAVQGDFKHHWKHLTAPWHALAAKHGLPRTFCNLEKPNPEDPKNLKHSLRLQRSKKPRAWLEPQSMLSKISKVEEIGFLWWDKKYTYDKLDWFWYSWHDLRRKRGPFGFQQESGRLTVWEAFSCNDQSTLGRLMGKQNTDTYIEELKII